MRMPWHCTSWFSGLIAKKKSYEVGLVGSKHEESFDAVTVVAILVPPDPNPVESVTYAKDVNIANKQVLKSNSQQRQAENFRGMGAETAPG